MLLGSGGTVGPDAGLLGEGLVGRLIAHQLHPGDEAFAPHLAHQLVFAEPGQPSQEMGFHGPHMAEDVLVVIDAQHLAGQGRRHRMAGIGEGEAEDAQLFALIQHGVEDALIDQQARDWQIGAG